MIKTQPDKLDYRLDYSPKCIHCSNYDYEEDICIMENEETSLEYPSCNQFEQRQDDYCEHCGKPYEEGEDEEVLEHDGYEEFWGAMVVRPDVLVGFACFHCGKYTEFV